MSWDEPRQRETGTESFNYMFNGNNSLLEYDDRYYGTGFELPLVISEKVFFLKDSREIFLMRHLLNFLLFYLAVYFFYRICKDYFGNWKIGLIGSLFLILSPRIFAESFYNSKDLAFLSVFIISVYGLIRWIEKKSFLRTFIHALLCALLIDIRILGILVPAITSLFFLYSFIKNKEDRKKEFLNFLQYIILLIIFIIIFWPILWNSPITNFIESFKIMGHYPWGGTVLYFGQDIKAINLPWHYVLVWMTITIPVLYLLGFLGGLLFLISFLFKKGINNYKKEDIIFLLWFFIPLFYVILFKSVLYDGWRQMYFIYPAFLIISLKGFVEVYNRIKNLKNGKFLRIIFISLVALALIFVILFYINNHPHENVYFNFLAGNPEKIKENFEMDYWGLSYRDALKYILNKDNRSVIMVAVENYPGIYNSYILLPEDRARLKYVRNRNESDYLLTEFRWHKSDYPYPEFYSIRVDGMKIMSVYKLR